MHQLTRLSLGNRAVIVLLCLTIVGAGLYAATTLRQELMPNMTVPMGSISAQYDGASPEVVERDVTEPIEDVLRGVTDVTRVTSTSSEGISQVTVEWEYGLDRNSVSSDIQAALDQAAPLMPEGVEPELMTFDFDSAPVISLGVTSDLSGDELAQQLDDVVVPALNRLPGVGTSQVTGQEVREVVVTLRQDDLDDAGIDPSQIQSLFQTYNSQVPGGQIDNDGSQLTVQTGSTLGSVEDIENLWLQGTDDPVQLRDVADVADQPADTNSIYRVNGEPALGLAVTKTADGNTVAVSNAVKAALPGLTENNPGNMQFSIEFDQAPYIEDSLKDLATEGVLGLIMAVLVIFVFLLQVRPTIISAISIPLSLLMALIGLMLGGFSLNLFTLAALTISIGRVVDDSIVVIENIERHRDAGEEFGMPMITRAVGEVAGAITAATFTTAAVFLPIAVVGGQIGELFRPFSLTAAIALLASLVVALTIVPVLAYWFMRPSRGPAVPTESELAAMGPRRAEQVQARIDRWQAKQDRRQAKIDAREAKAEERQRRDTEQIEARFQNRREALVNKMESRGKDQAQIDLKVERLREKYPTGSSLPADHDAHESTETRLQRGYLPILRWSLRHPVITCVAAVLIFILTMGMTPFLRTDYLGATGETTLTISQELPQGTPIAETDEKSREVEEVLGQNPAVDTYATTITGGGGQMAFLGLGGANTASYTVTLDPEADAAVVTQEIRDALDQLTDAGTISVAAATSGPGSSAISIQVNGNDDDSLAEGTQQVQDMLSGIPGMTEVTSDLSETTRLLQVDVDEDLAAELGMNQGTIGAAVASAISGTPLGQMQINNSQQDVVLLSREPITDREQLENLELPVTQVQTADAQQAEQDDIQAEQDAESDRQQAQADEQADEAEQQLIDQQSEMDDQIAELLNQISEVRSTPTEVGPMPAPPGPATPPSSPEEAAAAAAELERQQAEAQAQAEAEARAQVQAQVEALEEQLAQMREQRSALDDQLVDMRDQRAEAAEQRSRAEELAQRSEDLQDIRGSAVQLSDVAEVREIEAPAAINRVDSQQSVTVTGIPVGVDVGTVSAQIQQELATLDLPAGVTTSIGGVSQDQADSFAQLGIAMVVAIAIVYIIMVATFKSLLQPLILLVSVPFAATGAIALLLISGVALDIAGMIGFLMLIGVVVTNAIVLIDLINAYRSQGASVDDAVIQGSRLRLRPILMTAAATIFALFPMFLGVTGGSVFISRPLAVVVIGGLISSTLLTLILVPVLYHMLEKFRDRRNRRSFVPRINDADVDANDRLTDLFGDDPGTAPSRS